MYTLALIKHWGCERNISKEFDCRITLTLEKIHIIFNYVQPLQLLQEVKETDGKKHEYVVIKLVNWLTLIEVRL